MLSCICLLVCLLRFLKNLNDIQSKFFVGDELPIQGLTSKNQHYCLQPTVKTLFEYAG